MIAKKLSIAPLSRCVKYAQQQLGNVDAVELPNLRELRYAGMWGSDYSYVIPITYRGYPIGDLSRSIGYGEDPVKNYLILHTGCEMVIEAIEFQADQSSFTLGLNGCFHGSIEKVAVEDTRSIWRRIFHAKRVFAIKNDVGVVVGTVILQYPITSSDRLVFVSTDGNEFPIFLAPSVRNTDQNMLIASTCPRLSAVSEQTLLAISLCFRFLICSLNG